MARPWTVRKGAWRRRSTPLRQGDDVVQLFRTGFKEAPQVARGLANALLVLDERDAHEPFAVLAEANAGGNRDLGLLDEQRGKLDGVERRERRRQRRPGEHRGARRRHVPTGAAEAFDKHVAAA